MNSGSGSQSRRWVLEHRKFKFIADDPSVALKIGGSCEIEKNTQVRNSRSTKPYVMVWM